MDDGAETVGISRQVGSLLHEGVVKRVFRFPAHGWTISYAGEPKRWLIWSLHPDLEGSPSEAIWTGRALPGPVTIGSLEKLLDREHG